MLGLPEVRPWACCSVCGRDIGLDSVWGYVGLMWDLPGRLDRWLWDVGKRDLQVRPAATFGPVPDWAYRLACTPHCLTAVIGHVLTFRADP